MNREDKNKALCEINNVICEIEKFARSDNPFPSIGYIEFIASIGGDPLVVDMLSHKSRTIGDWCEDLTINYVILLLSKLIVELSLESS